MCCAAPKYLIHDRDSIFNAEAVKTMKAIGLKSVRTSFKSPWQNGIAERFVGNCRRDLLDHVIVLNERHLKRLMTEYVRYFHQDRTHLGLVKETPAGRAKATNPCALCRLSPRRDWVACIIATTSQSESRSSFAQHFQNLHGKAAREIHSSLILILGASFQIVLKRSNSTSDDGVNR